MPPVQHQVADFDDLIDMVLMVDGRTTDLSDHPMFAEYEHDTIKRAQAQIREHGL